MKPRALCCNAIRWVFLLPLAVVGGGAGALAAGLKLHVPSPDWRDQVIYFVMTDRFADGDARNNDQGAGEFRPGQRNSYQGGDLKGLRQRLDYIQGLGATALWITPPVANQWVNPSRDYFGYHGYWAENFLQVDRHLGNLADYRALSDALHRRRMYLVQDIVVNHMGNFFTYRDRWDPANPAHGFEPHDLTLPVPRPSQKPFDRNDPRDLAQQRAGVYHWTPDVRDYNDVQQEQNFQMSGLDDLNTENPVVRRALRQSYGHWVRKVGVDAFRVDTAFYVPPEYFADFLFAKDPVAPGLVEVAQRTGRRQFHVFGEGFAVDKPGQDRQARKIESYMTAAASPSASAPAPSPASTTSTSTQRRQGVPAGSPLLPGMLNFPLYGALGDVFARGRPTAELSERITGMMKLHARPHWMPTFVDNHDVDRFLAGGDTLGLQQALLAMFTLPGIPVIYYGTEQGFTEQRASMFAAGWGSGGRDHFNTQAPLYRSIAQMAALRRTHPVLSRGVPKLLKSNAAQPGALAWVMLPPSRSGQRAALRSQAVLEPVLVVFNAATSETLLDNLDIGAAGVPPGTRLQGAFGLQGVVADRQVGPDGRLSLVLPPRSAQVWVARRATEAADASGAAAAKAGLGEPAPPSIAPLLHSQVGADFDVNGVAPPGARLQLVVDGDLARAQTVLASPDGRWQARVGTADMIDADVEHHLTVWHGESGRAAPGRSFRVQRQWELQADVVDPAGDDTGPLGPHAGRYVYPTDPGWGAARQMDLRGVRLSTSGGALRLTLQMNQISQVWSPANGFDHVAFTVFIQLPGQPGGASVMPLQDGQVPEGLRWHRRLRVHGWSNALFSDAGASADKEGTPVTPAAQLQVDAQQHSVTFTLPAAALAGLPSLSGAKVWVTTWDYDGGYRPLASVAQAFGMGGAPAGSPKVMDSSVVIVLP